MITAVTWGMFILGVLVGAQSTAILLVILINRDRRDE